MNVGIWKLDIEKGGCVGMGINMEIKEALTKKALGYEVEEKEIIVNKNGEQTGKIKVIKKHIPPDIKAMEKIEELKKLGEWN